MTADLDFKMFWMLGSALFGAGGAFAAVKLTINQLKKTVDENKGRIEKRKEEIALHNIAIKIIDVKLSNILEIVKKGQEAREEAQKEHALRLRTIEGQLVRIDQKILNNVRKTIEE